MNSGHIDRLLLQRKQARTEKNWPLSDKLRDELDDNHVFVFDQKDGSQKAYQRGSEFFVHMVKAGGLYGIVFKSKRHYVEWRLQQEVLADKRFDAWLYSIQQSEAYQRIRQKHPNK